MVNIFFKFCSQKRIYFLLVILYVQGIVVPLNGAYTSVHETIEAFEVERKVDELLLLIQKRLVVMHEVARTKWNHNLPIEDKIREQQILADLAMKANHYGLDEKFAIQFFQAQMEASKEIQKTDFDLWRKNGVPKFEAVFSLKDELRIYIDGLNHKMMVLLSEIYAKPFSEIGKDILDHPISTRSSDSIENDVWNMAIFPLRTKP